MRLGHRGGALVECVDGGGEPVDVDEQLTQPDRMMVVEATVERFGQLGVPRLRSDALASSVSPAAYRWSAIVASISCRPETPRVDEAAEPSLTAAAGSLRSNDDDRAASMLHTLL